MNHPFCALSSNYLQSPKNVNACNSLPTQFQKKKENSLLWQFLNDFDIDSYTAIKHQNWVDGFGFVFIH